MEIEEIEAGRGDEEVSGGCRQPSMPCGYTVYLSQSKEYTARRARRGADEKARLRLRPA